MGYKMIEFSSSLKLNEIQRLIALSTRILKYTFLQGDPNFGEGRQEIIELEYWEFEMFMSPYGCSLYHDALIDWTVLTLPFSSPLVPRGVEPTPSYLKNCCPYEPKILQGIRDAFKSLKNVKVIYIVFTWLP